MKKVTNTTKNDAHLDWVLGGNPAMIEVQELLGQRELVESTQLPKKCNSPHGINASAQYAKMGIEVFTSSKGDDQFMGVKMPKGWEKKATDHSMWSHLLDDKGRKRASIFYKAAFYDREAFINFDSRYNVTSQYREERDGSGDTLKTIRVVDSATDEVLFETPECTWRNEGLHRKAADGWINEHFPNHDDINAYWD